MKNFFSILLTGLLIAGGFFATFCVAGIASESHHQAASDAGESGAQAEYSLCENGGYKEDNHHGSCEIYNVELKQALKTQSDDNKGLK